MSGLVGRAGIALGSTCMSGLQCSISNTTGHEDVLPDSNACPARDTLDDCMQHAVACCMASDSPLIFDFVCSGRLLVPVAELSVPWQCSTSLCCCRGLAVFTLSLTAVRLASHALEQWNLPMRSPVLDGHPERLF